MSKKDLLDLSLFDESQRKSQMTIKRPQLIRRSDPSIYDKQNQPEPRALKDFSKCNYFTTAPEYEYRKFSEVSLEQPSIVDYTFGLILTAVWVISNSSLLPATKMLEGDLLHQTTQLVLIKVAISTVRCVVDRPQPNSIDRGRTRYYIEVIILQGLANFFTIVLVHHLELNSTSLLLGLDCVVVALANRQKVALLGVLILPAVYYLNFVMMILGLVTMLILLRLHYIQLMPVQSIFTTLVLLLIILVISCFSDTFWILNMWTFVSLLIFTVNQIILVKFMSIISKHYVNEPFVYSLLRSSTIVLAIWQAVYIHPVEFSLVCVAVVSQMLCEFVNKDAEQQQGTIIPM